MHRGKENDLRKQEIRQKSTWLSRGSQRAPHRAACLAKNHEKEPWPIDAWDSQSKK